MTPESENTSVVLKYYLYRAIGTPGFIYPIYVLYLLSHGLGYAEIGVIGAAQSVVVVAGELPTGYVGDRIGRRNSLLVAQGLFAASTVGMIVGETFLPLLAAFLLLSLARTFVSGSDDAWLYETLQERLSEDRYTHVRGRGAAVGQWVMAATMIGGSLLYVLDPVYPFVALLVARVATAGVVRSLPKTAQYADDGGEDEDGDAGGDGLTVVEAIPVIREHVARPPLRSFVAYVALFLGATMTAGLFVQPITVDALESEAGALLASVGVPEAASLGVLYAAFTVVSALASDRASDLESALGVRGAVLAVPAVAGVFLVLPALVPLLAFPMFFVLRASQSVLRPITGQYVNDRVDSVGRATVLSAVSMVYSAGRIPFALAAGVLADVTGPLPTVAVLGGTFLVAGAALAAWWPPVQKESDAGTPPSAAAAE